MQKSITDLKQDAFAIIRTIEQWNIEEYASTLEATKQYITNIPDHPRGLAYGALISFIMTFSYVETNNAPIFSESFEQLLQAIIQPIQEKERVP